MYWALPPGAPVRRPGSPRGGSTLTTSAPSHARYWQQDGPASYWVKSSTRMPSSAGIVHPPDLSSSPGSDVSPALTRPTDGADPAETTGAPRRCDRPGGRPDLAP